MSGCFFPVLWLAEQLFTAATKTLIWAQFVERLDEKLVVA